MNSCCSLLNSVTQSFMSLVNGSFNYNISTQGNLHLAGHDGRTGRMKRFVHESVISNQNS